MIKLIKLGSLSDFEARLNFQALGKMSFNPLKYHVSDKSILQKLTDTVKSIKNKISNR